MEGVSRQANSVIKGLPLTGGGKLSDGLPLLKNDGQNV